MKRQIIMLAGIIAALSAISHASAWRGNGVTLQTGESISASKISVSTTTATTLSAYSGSRSRLVCRNGSSTPVFIGTFTAITANGPSTYLLDVSTSTQHTYDTTNLSALYGIGLGGASATVYCIEER